MTGKRGWRIVFRVVLGSVLLGAVLYCVAVAMALRRGKMTSQVALLSRQVASEFRGGDDPEALRAYLSTEVEAGRGLFGKDASGRILDSYGNPLMVEVEAKGDGFEVVVRSLGRDGIEGTGDDHSARDKVVARRALVN